MENIKQLNSLIDQATADTMKQPSMALFNSILDFINSRVDMPKHCIAGISRRMSIKSSKVTQLVFHLLEFICYNNELSLYSQIATKQFLFKISGLLMDKNTTEQTQLQILRTLSCLHKLFLPFQDLLPLFFQFYNGMIKKGIKVPNDYFSPYQPKQQKKTYKKQLNSQKNRVSNNNNKQLAIDEVLEQIWNKIIIANEIIENANPQDSIKFNPLLLQMMQHIKQAQKTVTKLINDNINQKSMELALAVNDDICITKRRFKDLQRNKKPQPYIPSELASDKNKQKFQKKNQQKVLPKKQQNFVEKQQINIMDIDFNQKSIEINKQNKNQIFDLLDIQPSKVRNNAHVVNFNNLQLNYPNNYPLGDNPNPQFNKQSIKFTNDFSLLNLNTDNQFKIVPDIKQHRQETLADKITDLSDFKQFFGNKNNKK